METAEGKRCVIVGGAGISCPDRVREYLKDDDYVIYCDSGLEHMNVLGAPPDLIIGDFDSHDDPHLDVETITLPVAKDDTDSVFAVKEGIKRGFKSFLIAGAIGERLDHTLVNIYILTRLANRGCNGIIVDDYSEMELICGAGGKEGSGSQTGTAYVSDKYPYFSLVAIEGPAHGVTIRNAKFTLIDADITPDYQFATSNEPLPGNTAEISIKDGRLLLIKIR